MKEDIVYVNGMPLPSRATRKKLVVGTLLFCGSLIVGVVTQGDPANTLHASALAWSFSISIAVIMGYVFGAVFDNANVLKMQNTLTKGQD